jgi:hypothetical protein
MPRLIFVRDYIYTPTEERRVSTKFKAGPREVLVNSDCAGKAITAGAAIWPKSSQPAPVVVPRRRRRK